MPDLDGATLMLVLLALKTANLMRDVHYADGSELGTRMYVLLGGTAS